VPAVNTPVPALDIAIGPLAAARRLALQKALLNSRDPLYAIVDVAIDERLYDALQAEPAASQVVCLYDGDPAIRYARYAPYLMRVHDGSPLFLRWLGEEGWQKNWGVFIASSLALSALKRHLKRFITTTDPHGKTLWLRFYDPRVLPNLLAGFNPGNLQDWFRGNAITACLAPVPQGVWRGAPLKSGFDHITGVARLESRIWEVSASC